MEVKEKPLSMKQRFMSFSHAFTGLGQLLKNEPNFRIHLAVTSIVVLGGVFLHISAAEWLILTLTIGFVLVAESLNSAVEKLCDIVSPEKNNSCLLYTSPSPRD